MLEVGWSEIILIAALAIIVIGPKELPALMYGLGRLMRRLHYIKFALSQQFDDFMKEADVRGDIAKSVNFEMRDLYENADEDEELAAAPSVTSVKEENAPAKDVKKEEGAYGE